MKYQTGYYMTASAWCSRELYRKLKSVASQCGRFIVGIPSKDAMSYMLGEVDDAYQAAAEAEEFWKSFVFVDDVMVLDCTDLRYQDAYRKIKFDVCFYGSEYGCQFQKDRNFFLSNGVDFISLAPSDYPAFASDIRTDALFRLLTACRSAGMKIITFGSGGYFNRYINTFGTSFPPAYTVDNNASAWGTSRNGVQVCSPAALEDEDPSKVLIIICVKNPESIIEQIAKIKEFDYRTLLYNQDCASAENIPFIRTRIENNRVVLKKIQQINYDLLEEFDRICTRHGITYYINYGTLLGAIRHKAFIPWDNDVDVIMKRPELEKLRHFSNEFSASYYWLSPDMLGKKKYYDSINRIGYKNAYIHKTDGSAEFYLNYYNGIHLDMFFVDRTYDDFKGKLQRLELAVLYGMMNAYRHKSLFFDYDRKMRFYNSVLCFFGRLLPLKFLRSRADKVARRFDADTQAPYYFISNCALSKLRLLFPKTVFDKPAVRLQFGGLHVLASAEYDLMCTKLFGDYKKLPPLEERIPHLGREILDSSMFVFEAPEHRGL